MEWPSRVQGGFVRNDSTHGELHEQGRSPGHRRAVLQETKPKAALIRQVELFWKLIPDLTWEPQDLVIDGNKVVVRSIASGSPKGNCMGLTLDGTRSFKIDTTDIHELEGGQIVRVHHLEDWATAMKQLSGRA